MLKNKKRMVSLLAFMIIVEVLLSLLFNILSIVVCGTFIAKANCLIEPYLFIISFFTCSSNSTRYPSFNFIIHNIYEKSNFFWKIVKIILTMFEISYIWVLSSEDNIFFELCVRKFVKKGELYGQTKKSVKRTQYKK